MIQGGGKRENTLYREGAPCGFKSGDTAAGSWNADTAAAVRSQDNRGKPGGHGRGTSARHQGYIVSDSEMDEGAMAIAAPVFHASGKLCAALSLAGPRERLTDNQSSLISATRAYAAKISRALGFSPAHGDPCEQIKSDKKMISDTKETE